MLGWADHRYACLLKSLARAWMAGFQPRGSKGGRRCASHRDHALDAPQHQTFISSLVATATTM
eukprot:8009786-Alexandrium_andersonii.AAC.1